MNLRIVRDQVAKRVANFPCVRRVYSRLGNPPRIIIDLVPTATSDDDKAIRIALASLNSDVHVDIIHSSAEKITADIDL